MADANVSRYRAYLKQLIYPEYAYRQATNAASRDESVILDLSLWNDDLPPGVIDAAARALPKAVGAYGLAQDSALITALAQKLGVPSGCVTITAGADDALRVAAQYSIRPGTVVLIPTPCFGRYVYHTMVNQGRIIYSNFNSFPFELDAVKIAAHARRYRAECIFIASPNNPTGHALSMASIMYLLDNVTASVVLDESLLLSTGDASSAALVQKYTNLFVCGSFSKLYGLAGLRIGYLLANQAHVKQLRQLMSPFGVDALGLEIAKYVITDDVWVHERIATIQKGLAALRTIRNSAVRVTRTTAPVALIEHTGGAKSLYQALHSAGVLTVASQEFPGLAETDAVRVIIKNVQDMRRLKRILGTVA